MAYSDAEELYIEIQVELVKATEAALAADDEVQRLERQATAVGQLVQAELPETIGAREAMAVSLGYVDTALDRAGFGPEHRVSQNYHHAAEQVLEMLDALDAQELEQPAANEGQL